VSASLVVSYKNRDNFGEKQFSELRAEGEGKEREGGQDK
jgi:hypothetical protein